jgi:hypothetical protein
MYKQGDSNLRNCIAQATLEHLFEQEPIREFFADWMNDEVLALAYRDASEWYQVEEIHRSGSRHSVPRNSVVLAQPLDKSCNRGSAR